MCVVCGCAGATVDGDGHHHGHSHSHDHDHDHGHGHHHGHHHDYGAGPARAHAPGLSQTRMVAIERGILAKNDAYAAENRQAFRRRGIFALNLLSSPGAGKTTLLVATLERLAGRMPAAVIEGDQQTSLDADRIRATGAPAVQINTGKGCHLDAHMIGHAVGSLALPERGLLFIENVGNLVCPAAFDLGEAKRVVLLSVTEGEDKPVKYPDIFAGADLVLINKVDAAPFLGVDLDALRAAVARVNPGAAVLHVSARTGEGMEDWLAWLMGERNGWLAAPVPAAGA
ncbi:MAG TPA: hydrogenase nickel incorporation protein HypB [Azospirillum sp.]